MPDDKKDLPNLPPLPVERRSPVESENRSPQPSTTERVSEVISEILKVRDNPRTDD